MNRIEKVERVIEEQASNMNSSALLAYAMLRVQTQLAEMTALFAEMSIAAERIALPGKVHKHEGKPA